MVLPVAILFPFGLVYLATTKASIRRPLMIVYRTPLIGRWGAANQMLRRLILVIISTFTLIPQTVIHHFHPLLIRIPMI
jgi:hypothetical protein